MKNYSLETLEYYRNQIFCEFMDSYDIDEYEAAELITVLTPEVLTKNYEQWSVNDFYRFCEGSL